MAENYNRDKTKKWQTTNSRSLVSCDQFFWFTSNQLELANTCCNY